MTILGWGKKSHFREGKTMVFRASHLKMCVYHQIRVCFQNDSWVKSRLLVHELHRDEVGGNTKFETQAGELLGHLRITFKSTKRPIQWTFLGLFSCGFLQHDMKQPSA